MNDFEPQPDGLFRIVDPAPFEAAWEQARRHEAAGAFDEAARVRFEACQRLLELLPDEGADPVALDAEAAANRAALLLLSASAIDHFLIGEFELAAALLESLLDLDEEDHLGATPTLAWCYVALNEPESLEALCPDLDEKSPETALVDLWAAHRFGGSLPAGPLAAFRQKHPAFFAEFTAADHPTDAAWLADIDGERPSAAARARRLWLQTEPLWQCFPDFIAALKAAP